MLNFFQFHKFYWDIKYGSLSETVTGTYIFNISIFYDLGKKLSFNRMLKKNMIKYLVHIRKYVKCTTIQFSIFFDHLKKTLFKIKKLTCAYIIRFRINLCTVTEEVCLPVQRFVTQGWAMVANNEAYINFCTKNWWSVVLWSASDRPCVVSKIIERPTQKNYLRIKTYIFCFL
jgi:hypothetical protein